MKMKYSFLSAALLIGLGATAQIKNLPEGFTAVNNCEATIVKNQGRTGTCWSFSTSSFIESEVLRTQGKTIDLSEMFTVRNIYLEKAINYVRYHGTVNFSQGSLAHDVLYSYEKYGMMPEVAYSGMNGAKYHDHSKMEGELKAYLDTLLAHKPVEPHWKQGFTDILDKYMGPVKPMFEFEGQTYNAQSFAQQVLKLDVEDYVGITSFTHHEYYDDFVLEVPDNFSRGEYNNLPLNEMMTILNDALAAGYSVEWDGDVSEIGFGRKSGFAVYTEDTAAMNNLPVLPAEMPVSQDLRQAEFDNQNTTDDHLMHITGMVKSADGRVFYVVKNSWSEKAGIEGYALMSESYMKMKTISIMVHKSAIKKSMRKKLDD